MDPIPGTELNQTQYSVQDVQRYMDRWFGCNAVSSLDTGDQAYCRVDVQCEGQVPILSINLPMQGLKPEPEGRAFGA